jgi:hypothetical protein
VISSPAYGAVVFMAIATTVVTPLLLRFAFPKSPRPVASDPQPEYCPDFVAETPAWDALPPSSS